MWIMYAVFGAFTLAISAVLSKVGLKEINSTIATVIITVIVLIVNLTVLFFSGTYKNIPEFSRRSLIYLILTGLMVGLSWFFYYRAMQLGPVSKVIPIDKLSLVITLVLSFLFLHEPFTPKMIAGTILMVIGTVAIVL